MFMQVIESAKKLIESRLVISDCPTHRFTVFQLQKAAERNTRFFTVFDWNPDGDELKEIKQLARSHQLQVVFTGRPSDFNSAGMNQKLMNKAPNESRSVFGSILLLVLGFALGVVTCVGFSRQSPSESRPMQTGKSEEQAPSAKVIGSAENESARPDHTLNTEPIRDRIWGVQGVWQEHLQSASGPIPAGAYRGTGARMGVFTIPGLRWLGRNRCQEGNLRQQLMETMGERRNLSNNSQ